MLIVFSGRSGTGKTTIARALATEIDAVYLRIDSIEQAIRESAIGNSSVEDAGYRAAYAIALDNLRIGRTVVADCVNPIALTRDAWRDVARHAGVDLFDVEVMCSDASEHHRRVTTRTTDVTGLRLPTWAEVVAREYHEWNCDRLVVDTAQLTPEQTVGTVRAAIATRSHHAPVRLLVLTGSMGAGKTTVMAEASDILTAHGVVHACIDVDQLSLAHAGEAKTVDDLVYDNLRSLWHNFTATGVSSLLLASALENRSALDRLRAAIQPQSLTVCRVRASPSTMEDRVRTRDPGMLQDQLVARVSMLDAILDAAALEDFAITNDGRAVTDVAHELLVRAGWLARK